MPGTLFRFDSVVDIFDVDIKDKDPSEAKKFSPEAYQDLGDLATGICTFYL